MTTTPAAITDAEQSIITTPVVATVAENERSSPRRSLRRRLLPRQSLTRRRSSRCQSREPSLPDVDVFLLSLDDSRELNSTKLNHSVIHQQHSEEQQRFFRDQDWDVNKGRSRPKAKVHPATARARSQPPPRFVDRSTSG
eukprot:2635226-Prymnesium_polylepis.1